MEEGLYLQEEGLYLQLETHRRRMRRRCRVLQPLRQPLRAGGKPILCEGSEDGWGRRACVFVFNRGWVRESTLAFNQFL